MGKQENMNYIQEPLPRCILTPEKCEGKILDKGSKISKKTGNSFMRNQLSRWLFTVFCTFLFSGFLGGAAWGSNTLNEEKVKNIKVRGHHVIHIKTDNGNLRIPKTNSEITPTGTEDIQSRNRSDITPGTTNAPRPRSGKNNNALMSPNITVPTNSDEKRLDIQTISTNEKKEVFLDNQNPTLKNQRKFTVTGDEMDKAFSEDEKRTYYSMFYNSYQYPLTRWVEILAGPVGLVLGLARSFDDLDKLQLFAQLDPSLSASAHTWDTIQQMASWGIPINTLFNGIYHWHLTKYVATRLSQRLCRTVDGLFNPKHRSMDQSLWGLRLLNDFVFTPAGTAVLMYFDVFGYIYNLFYPPIPLAYTIPETILLTASSFILQYALVEFIGEKIFKMGTRAFGYFFKNSLKDDRHRNQLRKLLLIKWKTRYPPNTYNEQELMGYADKIIDLHDRLFPQAENTKGKSCCPSFKSSTSEEEDHAIMETIRQMKLLYGIEDLQDPFKIDKMKELFGDKAPEEMKELFAKDDILKTGPTLDHALLMAEKKYKNPPVRSILEWVGWLGGGATYYVGNSLYNTYGFLGTFFSPTNGTLAGNSTLSTYSYTPPEQAGGWIYSLVIATPFRSIIVGYSLSLVLKRVYFTLSSNKFDPDENTATAYKKWRNLFAVSGALAFGTYRTFYSILSSINTLSPLDPITIGFFAAFTASGDFINQVRLSRGPAQGLFDDEKYLLKDNEISSSFWGWFSTTRVAKFLSCCIKCQKKTERLPIIPTFQEDKIGVLRDRIFGKHLDLLHILDHGNDRTIQIVYNTLKGQNTVNESDFNKIVNNQQKKKHQEEEL
jgi:hypothetical protein